MSRIQDHFTLYNFARAAVVIGSTYWMRRCIRYSQGASKGSLVFSGALGCGITVVRETFAAENESESQRVQRFINSFVISSIITTCLATVLKGRVSARVAVFCQISFYVSSAAFPLIQLLRRQHARDRIYSTEELRALHARYLSDPQAWENLLISDHESIHDARNLIKQFYEGDFPPLPMEVTIIRHTHLADPSEFSERSENQLGWHAEMVRGGYCNINDEDLFALNRALHAQGLPMVWDDEGGISSKQVNYAKGKSECENLLYEYFKKNPFEHAFLKYFKEFDFENMFEGNRAIHEYLHDITPDYFKGLRMLKLLFISQMIKGKIRNYTESLYNWEKFSISQQAGFNIAANAHRRVSTVSIDITQKVVESVKRDDDALKWLHDWYSQAPIEFALIKGDLRTQLNTSFNAKGHEQIKNPRTIFDELTVEKINGFHVNAAKGWREFLKQHKSWEFNDKEIATAFVKAFIKHDQPLFLPLADDPSKIHIALITPPQLNSVQPHQFNVVCLQSYNQIRWLLLLNSKKPFLEENVRVALTKRFQKQRLWLTTRTGEPPIHSRFSSDNLAGN